MIGKVTAMAVFAAALIGAGAAQAQILTNGGFEGTVHASGGNPSVPDGWTSNEAYDSEPSFNHVTTFSPHSGSFALSIGNFDAQPLAALSQTFGDIAGEIYSVSFWGFAGSTGDPAAFLMVSAGGSSVTFDDSVTSYAQGVFSFVGSGSDTLTIAAKTNPSEWFVDDVSVTDTGRGAGVPEPAAWTMMILGFGGVGAGLRRRQPALRLA